jgi:PKD repeat protein
MDPSSTASNVYRSLVALAAACVTVASSAAALETESRQALGALSVVTEPADARVFIDGVPAGLTPLRRGDVSAATHRVKIVKDGYLENSRLIDVSHNRIANVSVKLTPSAGRAGQSAGAQPATTASSSGVNKWIWIGLAGGGAAVAAVALTRNHAPEPGAILVSPTGTGMAGQTNFAIESTATDPDKDSLTYTWNLGDGTSATGQSVTHLFSTAGVFQISLTISDGKQTVTAPNASVTVGPNLTGTWTGGSILMPDATGRVIVNCGINLVLQQAGNGLRGTIPFTGGCPGAAGSGTTGTVTALTHPAPLTLVTDAFAFAPAGSVGTGLVVAFSGSTSSAGTSIVGNITLSQPSSGFVQTTSTSFTKQ